MRWNFKNEACINCMQYLHTQNINFIFFFNILKKEKMLKLQLTYAYKVAWHFCKNSFSMHIYDRFRLLIKNQACTLISFISIHILIICFRRAFISSLCCCCCCCIVASRSRIFNNIRKHLSIVITILYHVVVVYTHTACTYNFSTLTCSSTEFALKYIAARSNKAKTKGRWL